MKKLSFILIAIIASFSTVVFAGSEIIGRFTPNSGVELAKSHNVYFDLSQISIFDKETELRL